MKHLNEYIEEKYFEYEINEGLLSGILGFFKKIFKSQVKLSKSGKKIKIDINNIKRSKKPIDFENLETSQYKQLLSDKTSGFPILNEFVKNPKKYIGKNPDNAKTYLHFSKIKKDILQCGALMLNENPEFRPGEAYELLCLDTSLLVENENEVNKQMVNIWMTEVKKNKDIKYIFCKPTHPKQKGIITSIGFSQDKANKEIYILQVK